MVVGGIDGAGRDAADGGQQWRGGHPSQTRVLCVEVQLRGNVIVPRRVRWRGERWRGSSEAEAASPFAAAAAATAAAATYATAAAPVADGA